MSRGLGCMQREILENLKYSKTDQQLWYTGYDWMRNEPGWVIHRNKRFLLSDDMYDLRGVLKLMAKGNNKTCCNGSFVEISYQASFSRAVRGLEKRGILNFPGLIPVSDWDQKEGLYFCSDGVFFFVSEKQRRFCSISENIYNAKRVANGEGD